MTSKGDGGANNRGGPGGGSGWYGGGGWWGGYASNTSSGGGGGSSCLVDVGSPSATISGNPENTVATIPIAGSATSASYVKGNWGNGFARITFANVSRLDLD